MPIVVDKLAAFNFCNPFDDVLPNPLGSIDTDDMAQLWGCYSLGDFYVDEVNENANLVPLSNFSYMLIDHETGDTSQYDSVVGALSIEAPGFNNTNYRASYDPSGSNHGLILPSLLSSDYYIKVDCYFSHATDLTSKHNIPAGVAILSSFGEIRFETNQFNGSSFYELKIQIIDDVGSPTTSLVVSGLVGGTAYHIAMEAYLTGTGGVVKYWLDDVLWDTKTGLDIDSTLANITNIRVGGVGGGGGTTKVDEVYLTVHSLETIYVLGLIRTLAETVNITEVIIHLTNKIRLLAETINIFLVGDSNIFIDHETGDLLQYTTPPSECVSLTLPGLNFTNYALQVEATAIIGGIKLFAAPSGNRFEISFYLDLSCFTTEVGVTDVLGIRITDGGANEVLRTEILSTDGVPTGLQYVVTNDVGGESSAGAFTTRADEHQYKLILYKATGASANDGSIEFYVDSVFKTSTTGIDLFTNWANLTDLEVGILDLPGGDGYILIDEIAVNTESATAIYILRTAVAKIINETLQIIEVMLSVPLFLIRVLDETLNISESVLRLYTLLLRIVADTLNISETNLNVKGLYKLITDTLNVVENALGVLALLKIIANTVNVSETKLGLLGRIRILAESVNISEAIISPFARIKILLETLNISETRLRVVALVRVIVDGLAVSIQDRRLKVVGWIRVQTDTINISELQIGPFGALFRILNETLNISEGLLRLSTVLRVIDETLNISETVLRIRGLVRRLLESVSISSVVIAVFSLVRVLSETLYITPTILGIKALVRIIASNLNISETILNFRPMIKILAEIVNIDEGSLIRRGLDKIINEVVNISEGILRKINILKFASETLNISESVLRFRTFINVLNENLLVSEAIKNVLGLIRIITDGTLSIVESLLRPKTIINILPETINISEVVSGSAILYLISKITKKTGVTIGDTLRRIKLRDREVL